MEERLRNLAYQIDLNTLKNLGIFVGCCIYWLYGRLCIESIKGIQGKIFAVVPLLMIIYFLTTGCTTQSQQQTQVNELSNQEVIAEVTICQEAEMAPSLLKNVYGGISKVVCEMNDETGKEIELRRRVLGE